MIARSRVGLLCTALTGPSGALRGRKSRGLECCTPISTQSIFDSAIVLGRESNGLRRF